MFIGDYKIPRHAQLVTNQGNLVLTAYLKTRNVGEHRS